MPQPLTVRTVNMGHPSIDLLVTIDEMTDGARVWAESAYKLNDGPLTTGTWASLADAVRNFSVNYGCQLLVAKR